MALFHQIKMLEKRWDITNPDRLNIVTAERVKFANNAASFMCDGDFAIAAAFLSGILWRWVIDKNNDDDDDDVTTCLSALSIHEKKGFGDHENTVSFHFGLLAGMWIQTMALHIL